MIDSGTDINLSVLEKYVGDYLLDVNLVKPEKAARVSVAICGKQLCLTVADEYSVQVWPRSESLFFHQTSEFTIEFVRNDEGLVSGCIITLGGSRVNGIRATPSAEDESH
ncbi:MAG: hypothetical protein DRP45_09970 [Candidatus Zixiibacteriota bacterium]|nr:MAG: hypothetical protein DRP45_09970 [candidate division Zixibacteria bacterium]